MLKRAAVHADVLAMEHVIVWLGAHVGVAQMIVLSISAFGLRGAHFGVVVLLNGRGHRRDLNIGCPGSAI